MISDLLNRFLPNSGDDPKKPSPKQLASANEFAKQFALRKGLMIGANAHVGNQIPKFIDSMTGQENVPNQLRLPPRTIMDIRQVPSYVTPNDIVMGQDQVPYFEDQQSGDMIPIHPDILRSPRFNPNRGQHDVVKN